MSKIVFLNINDSMTTTITCTSCNFISLPQIRRLEQLPPGSSQHSGSDTDLARDHQVAQLKIDQLERQKTELLSELQVLREKSSHSGLNEMVCLFLDKMNLFIKPN